MPVYTDKEDVKEGDYFSLYHAKREGALDHFLLKVDHEEDNTLEQYKEKFYWFGFLCGTGNIDFDNYLISIEFEAQDIDHVKKFIKILGCEKEFQIYTKKDKITGNKTKMARIEFKSRLMVEDLEQLGWFGPASRVKNLPPIVNALIQHSKQICHALKVDWTEPNAGKLALTWLLGFYDATGIYHGNMDAEIRQEGEAGKELLLQFKDAYGIENKVEKEFI